MIFFNKEMRGGACAWRDVVGKRVKIIFKVAIEGEREVSVEMAVGIIKPITLNTFNNGTIEVSGVGGA